MSAKLLGVGFQSSNYPFSSGDKVFSMEYNEGITYLLFGKIENPNENENEMKIRSVDGSTWLVLKANVKLIKDLLPR